MSCVLPLLLLVVGQELSPEESPRKLNPLAPSLPLLTKEEERKLDDIVDKFIEYDIGNLPGPEGKAAFKAFHNLGPEATFALIRGLNKSAKIDHSCPALTIARKLSGILRTSNDGRLLEYARENVGAGVERSKHMDAIKDVRMTATTRKNLLLRTGPRELRTP